MTLTSRLGVGHGPSGQATIIMSGKVSQGVIDSHIHGSAEEIRLIGEIRNIGTRSDVKCIVIDLRGATEIDRVGYSMVRTIVQRAINQPITILHDENDLGKEIQRILVSLTERCKFTTDPEDPEIMH